VVWADTATNTQAAQSPARWLLFIEQFTYKMFRYVYIFILLIELISCNSNNSEEYASAEIQMAEIAPYNDIAISHADSINLMKSWKNVMTALENNNVSLLKAYSFDTLNCQACKSYPRGTNVEDMLIRRMLPDKFLNFYRDSFLYPKVLKYSSTVQYEIDMLAFYKDSIEVHRIRFIDSAADRWKSSLQFYFLKREDTFRFLGLYL